MRGGLVMRYNTAKVDDGLPPGEGVFLACSFWMVSSLKAIGRVRRCTRTLPASARAAQRPWACFRSNTIPSGKRLVGNFPQAFSHIALVNAAFDLDDGAGVRKRAHRNSHKHPATASPPTAKSRNPASRAPSAKTK